MKEVQCDKWQAKNVEFITEKSGQEGEREGQREETEGERGAWSALSQEWAHAVQLYAEE